MNRSRVTKDAVIGVAIFVVLLLLWRLMTRSERWGAYGPQLRTNIFGAFGAGLAETLGVGADATGSTTEPSSSGFVATNGARFSGTNPPVETETGSVGSGAPADDAEFILSNAPVKVIGHLPANLSDTNRPPASSTSPDAAAVARRLAQAGAGTGDIQFSLAWKNYNDLDLHCIDPRGVRIYYSHPRSELTGGELDVDANAGLRMTREPVENIFWPRAGAPAGIYKVYVVYYAPHDGVDATAYSVRTVVKGQTNWFRNTITYAGERRSQWICTIQYAPANPDPAQRARFLQQQ